MAGSAAVTTTNINIMREIQIFFGYATKTIHHAVFVEALTKHVFIEVGDHNQKLQTVLPLLLRT